MSVKRSAWNFVTSVLFRHDGAAKLRDVDADSDEFWREVISLGNAHFITPALWVVLKEATIADMIPALPREYLSTSYELNLDRNLGLERQLDDIIGTLNESGIVPLLLKGSAYLKSGIYANAGERFLTDIDVLVGNEVIGSARNALSAIGYRDQTENPHDYSGHHHLHPLYKPGSPCVVDLHRRPLGTSASPLLTAEEMFAESSVISRAAIEFRIPEPTQLLLHSFLHTEVNDRHLRRGVIGLRPLLDTSRLHSKLGRNIDWSSIYDRLKCGNHEALFRTYLHVIGRIAAIRPIEKRRVGARDRLHYFFLRAVTTSPYLDRWMGRMEKLSAYRIEQRYGRCPSVISLNLLRLRRLSGMIVDRSKRWIAAHRRAREQSTAVPTS